MPKRILLIGGPSTGKTTLINHLRDLGYRCMDEISREVTAKAQAEGIDQLFLEQPLLFSELLRDARIAQYNAVTAMREDFVFLDRGIPDTTAYMDFIEQDYPATFDEDFRKYPYDTVFVLPPWEEIHVTDAERYENFEQAQAIHKALLKTYTSYGYSPVEVPTGPVKERAQFVLKTIGV